MSFSWRSSQEAFRKFATAFAVPTLQKRAFARMEFGKSIVGAPFPFVMIPEFEEVQTKSSLKFRLESAAVLIPHRSKEKRGGEDAVFARYFFGSLTHQQKWSRSGSRRRGWWLDQPGRGQRNLRAESDEVLRRCH